MTAASDNRLMALAQGLAVLQLDIETRQPALLADDDITRELASLELDLLGLQALCLRIDSDPASEQAAALEQLLQLASRSLSRRQAELARNLLGYYSLVDETIGTNEPSVVPAPALQKLALSHPANVDRGCDHDKFETDHLVRRRLARHLGLATEPMDDPEWRSP